MRRLLALTLVAPLLLVAAPAYSGPITRIPVHGLDPERWSMRTYDCAGAPATGAEFALERMEGPDYPVGVLDVAAPDTMAGVMQHGTRWLSTTHVHVDALAGSAPTFVWRVEAGGHVLLSDPQ